MVSISSMSTGILAIKLGARNGTVCRAVRHVFIEIRIRLHAFARALEVLFGFQMVIPNGPANNSYKDNGRIVHVF